MRNVALADLEGLLVVMLGDRCAASRQEWFQDLRQQAEQAVERCEAAGTAGVGADTLLAIAAVEGFSNKVLFLPCLIFGSFLKGFKDSQVICRAQICINRNMKAQEAELHAVLAMPLDGTVLLAALRRVDPPDAMFLARYLTKWLLRHNNVLHSNERLTAPSGCVVPGLANVLQWACALLDAHLIGLALLPPARPVSSMLASICC